MELEFRKAQRKAVPLIISVSGTSGSGKTYSALLLAAGLVKPGGRVALLDTENGRGEMYTDSPGIQKALWRGFEYARLDPPFTPKRYVEAIDGAEKAGIDVLVIDSGSHEWEGKDGCTDMAADRDYQVWIERVDDSGKIGIVMEDGEVAADHQREA